MVEAHADVIGSLLRPDYLLEARERFFAGELSPARFKAIEDRAVDEAVLLQEEAGLPVVTDGEMRRLSFQSQVVAAIDGFGEYDLNAFLWGKWKGDDRVGSRQIPRPENVGLTGRLQKRRSIAEEEFVYLRGKTNRIPKISLPSPGLFMNFWPEERHIEAYSDVEEFLWHVADILREEVRDLVQLGARYIQIDAPHYPLLIDPETRRFYEVRGKRTAEEWLRTWVALDNHVMQGAGGQVEGAESEVTFGLHMCRGNQASRWLVEGGYEPIAGEIFDSTEADRLLLEYDDHRSGSFEPLRDIPQDKIVVLGLITTKSSEREELEELRKRIHEAARFFPQNRLAISPQCGFATSVVGNSISREAQQYKLSLAAETAAAVWGHGDDSAG